MRIICSIIQILILSGLVFGQKKSIYQKSIDSKQIDNLTLNLSDAYLSVKQSKDNQIHFNFSIEFFNYSESEIDEIISSINTDLTRRENGYYFTLTSQVGLASAVYSFDADYGLFLDNTTFKSGDGIKRRFRKSKESLKKLVEDKTNGKQEKLLLMFKKYTESGEVVDINLEDEKSYRVSFNVEIPALENLNLNLENSEIDLMFNFEGIIRCLANKSKITTRELINNDNKFELVGGNLKSTSVKGGKYKFDSVDKVIIAEISNSEIESEFSDVSIGEMTSPIKITDFNSEYWFYELTPSESKYYFSGEYSKINMYYPSSNSDYKIETIGFNTAHYLENTRMDIAPNRENVMNKMLVATKDKSNDAKSVDFAIEIKNGVVRLGKDFIEMR